MKDSELINEFNELGGNFKFFEETIFKKFDTEDRDAFTRGFLMTVFGAFRRRGAESIELSFEPNSTFQMILSSDGRSLCEWQSGKGIISYGFQQDPEETKAILRSAVDNFFRKVEELKTRRLKIDEILEKLAKTTQKK